MSKFTKKKSGELPAISTASLPDIVFMLLFFFMVATTMRETTLMVKNTLPTADQVEKLDKKDLVMYIYAGKPAERYQQKYGTEARIQLNDKLIPYLTTALKVDKETNMGLVSDIKQELRKAEALKINYTTVQGDATTGNE